MWHVVRAHRSWCENQLYIGISPTSGGTGLILPVIAYLAAGVSQHKLGFAMGALAAAAGLGQTFGSSLAGRSSADSAKLLSA